MGVSGVGRATLQGLVVDFFGVGYLTGTEEKRSNQRVEVLWDLNGEILSEV